MRIEESGNFNNIEKWLKKVSKSDTGKFDAIGQEIVSRLSRETKRLSGKTASSWDYNIRKTSAGVEIEIINTNLNKGQSIAKMLHYGHGTGTGGWVEGSHFITKTIDPVYKNLISKVISDLLR